MSTALLAGEQHVVFAVRRLEIDDFAPAVIDDLLRVETRVAAIHGAAIDFAQTVARGDKILTSGKILVAVLRDGRPMRIPPALRALLEASCRRHSD